MKKAVFVGEEPSATAIRMGVKWEDGRLAAKQLFDAFEANNFDPSEVTFVNLFHQNQAIDKVIKCLKKSTIPVVAMGNKVQKSLRQHGVNHVEMVHPAARGSIRKKERYTAHVASVLQQLGIA